MGRCAMSRERYGEAPWWATWRKLLGSRLNLTRSRAAAWGRSAFVWCQSRQLSAHAGDAGADQGLVADEPEGKADQDWREGRQPRPLCRLPDGRGRHSEKPVHRHPAAGRRTTATAHYIHSVRRSIVMRSMQSVGKVRLDDGKHNIFRSPARRRPAPTPVHKVLWRFALARNASPGQYQAEIGGYPGNVSQ